MPEQRTLFLIKIRDAQKKVIDNKLINLNFKQFSEKKFFKMCQNGRCRQVFQPFWTTFKWPVAVVDRWSLFRGSFSTKIAMAGFRVVVVDRWSLFGGGR